MYNKLKTVMFKFDPETAHNIAEFFLKRAYMCKCILPNYSKKYYVVDETLMQTVDGINFLHPVGLAAGFDKNATMIEGLTYLGFGHIEYGTLTPKPQSGNPKPRLFRFPEFNSIQNAMGFNNEGAEVISKRVSKMYPFSIPLGANIGKNKVTPPEDALSDYSVLVDSFKDLADYLVINISSPNTKGLRDLQNEDFVKRVFDMATKKTNKPVYLKIAPDMEIEHALKISNCAINAGARGIIATNTTVDYSLLPNAKNFGGISGEVLKEKSYNFFKNIAQELFGKITLISVGGISTGEDAYARVKAGASLVQIYSSFIFKGPGVTEEINKALIKLLKDDGYSHISEAVGSDWKKND